MGESQHPTLARRARSDYGRPDSIRCAAGIVKKRTLNPRRCGPRRDQAPNHRPPQAPRCGIRHGGSFVAVFTLRPSRCAMKRVRCKPPSSTAAESNYPLYYRYPIRSAISQFLVWENTGYKEYFSKYVKHKSPKLINRTTNTANLLKHSRSISTIIELSFPRPWSIKLFERSRL